LLPPEDEVSRGTLTDPNPNAGKIPESGLAGVSDRSAVGRCHPEKSDLSDFADFTDTPLLKPAWG
jgi:hypothetical protein